MNAPNNTQDAMAAFSPATGSEIDPACGTGGFLASALGIWFTPQHVLDFLEGKPTANPDAILGNPPFGTESPNAGTEPRP
jgi:type I restriction-modification system DNA methylase subunit